MSFETKADRLGQQVKENLKDAYQNINKMISAEGFEDYNRDYQDIIITSLMKVRDLKDKI